MFNVRSQLLLEASLELVLERVVVPGDLSPPVDIDVAGSVPPVDVALRVLAALGSRSSEVALHDLAVGSVHQDGVVEHY